MDDCRYRSNTKSRLKRLWGGDYERRIRSCDYFLGGEKRLPKRFRGHWLLDDYDFLVGIASLAEDDMLLMADSAKQWRRWDGDRKKDLEALLRLLSRGYMTPQHFARLLGETIDRKSNDTPQPRGLWRDTTAKVLNGRRDDDDNEFWT